MLFAAQRLAFALVVLVAIVYLSFLGLDMAGGANLRDAAEPALRRTAAWLRHAVVAGDLGLTNAGSATALPRAVGEVVAERLPRSLGLLGVSLGFATLFGVGLGVLSAYSQRQGSLIVLLATLVGVSVPSFFAAFLLQWAVITVTRQVGRSLLPVGGFGWDSHLLLPALVLSARPLAQITRIAFVSTRQVLAEDYVGTARSKGLRQSRVVTAHVLRNAAIPILTRMAAPDSVYAAAVAQTTNVTALVDGLRARYCATLIQTFVWPLAPFPQRVGAGLPFAVIAVLGATLAWRAARRPAGFLPWIALFGLLMAMGPQLMLRVQQPVTVLGTAVPLPSALLDQLPLFERLWWPYRWIALTAVGAAGCGAALVAAIPAGRRADLLAVVLALAVLIEVRAMFVYAPYTAIAGDPQPLDVPGFLVALGEEPGEHPLLQLPLRRVDDAAVIYMSYHRQPVDGGPGYEDNMLIEPSYLRRTSENEALYALGRMAWGQEAPAVEDPRGELRALGFRYAVFWRGYVPADGRGHMPYSEFFDAEPVYEDEQILAWDLAPVAGTTGAGGP